MRGNPLAGASSSVRRVRASRRDLQHRGKAGLRRVHPEREDGDAGLPEHGKGRQAALRAGGGRQTGRGHQQGQQTGGEQQRVNPRVMWQRGELAA